MNLERLVRFEADRTIAAVRIALAALSLFAIWLDPAEPARYINTVYTLHLVYVAYSTIIAAIVFTGVRMRWLPIATHIFDIIIFSVFQYLTRGPSSPFFIYFIFFLFCSALKWGWRGTLAAIPIVVGSFVVMGMSMSQTLGPTDFELNRFIIRIGYLTMVGGLLVYLGLHESKLRDEIRRLAEWPPIATSDDESLANVLAYACELVRAKGAVLVWTPDEEPRIEFAAWRRDTLDRRSLPPDAIDAISATPLTDALWISEGPFSEHTHIDLRTHDGIGVWTGMPVHELLLPLLGAGPVMSGPYRTEQLSGRVFFTDVESPAVESFGLLAAVARQVGMTIDHMLSLRRQRAVDVGEERIRLAGDLHDGVLQSMTGVRLELQRVAGGLMTADADARDRLLTLERALALEQRELRLFIEDLRPLVHPVEAGSLAERLDSLQKRLSEQWNVPIIVRVDAARGSNAPSADAALVPLVNEAVVNALKHAHPSRVSVDVVRDGQNDTRITVVDDGRGFTFRGRVEHETLVARGMGPRSLRERVVTLGGRLDIDSDVGGSRIEMWIPARGPRITTL